jgi:hypothetical protein
MRRLAILVLMLAFSGRAFGQFEHPDLKSGKKQVSRVVLMPIEAVMGKLTVKSDFHWGAGKGPDYLEAESQEVEKDLTPVIAEVFRGLNCTVNDTALTSAELAKNAALQSTVQELQDQMDGLVSPGLVFNEEGAFVFGDHVRKGKASLGESVAKFQAASGADALVFVRVVGQILSGGRRAVNILNGANSSDTWHTWIMLVDARTGDVLYLAASQGRNNLAEDAGKARPAIDKSFKSFLKLNRPA